MNVYEAIRNIRNIEINVGNAAAQEECIMYARKMPRREQFVPGGPSLANEFARLRKAMLNK